MVATKHQKEDVVLASFATLSILQLVKDAQQKHGLRHGDYQRYRGYCARRVRRIRKSLGFTHIHKGVSKHTAKFIPRKLAFDIITEERFLQIAVFDAERNWSYAIQLKQEAGEDMHSRKRFHMIGKLRRAVKHASSLESIIKSCERVDAVTRLESQAYNSWMHGCLRFELKEWKGALECFRTTKKIYEKLATVVKLPDLVELYKVRCREIQPQMRYCEFNCGDDASCDAAMSEMINMRLQLSEEEGVLQEDFDKLIAELRTKAVVHYIKDIEWGNEKVSVTNDNVKNLLQALEQFDHELAQTTIHEDKMTLYEQLLSNIRDVIQTLNEEQKKLVDSRTHIDGAQSPNRLTIIYLEFMRLKRTIERYIMIIAHTKTQAEKKIKPQDLIRLCDTVIENSCEILELPGVVTNKDLELAYKVKAEYYRALRCFCLAEAHAALAKWNEANVLYDRAVERTSYTSMLLKNAEGNPFIVEKEDDLKNLHEQITASKFATQANRLVEAAGDNKCDTKQEIVDNRPLVDTLDAFRKITLKDLHKTEQSIRIIPVPPSFIPMPNKPMFFDLALNHIKMPDLESKIASYAFDKKETSQRNERPEKEAKSKQGEQDANQQGIGGLVKGWFWRK
ncbi:signal recognition particle 68 [Loa loa]|uniref:Signal recognition particle subunit SRP68 n=1 Tax=Loa loa TaxID=7209 RepID=A0A1I7VFG4_LOALO|nr:signal recognition particle 68 [Loa loa]EFO22206.1 signal recognition particle 68 [Loa loa]